MNCGKWRRIKLIIILVWLLGLSKLVVSGGDWIDLYSGKKPEMYK